MLDLALVAVAAVFFGVAIAYARGCDRM